jgi:hypothetical protein
MGVGRLASASACRDLGRHLSIRLESAYLTYREDLGIGSVPEVQPPRSILSVQILPLAAGARLYAKTPEFGGARPYFQILPTVFVSRWVERNRYPAGPDLNGVYHPAFTETDAFVKILPGFGAGVGLEGPLSGSVRLDLGARYLCSIGFGQQQLGRFSSGGLKGLRQLGLVANIRLPL